MPLKKNFRNTIRSDWFLSLILLAIFLVVMGYKYNWDDQHLEIPLLKSLIDPNLYPGDYYVQSLKNNFTSYFYIILSRIITVGQIPAAYFILYLFSRYFLLFWTFKLWKFVAQEKSAAFICTAIFIFFGHTPEFLYRTFSHQEFSFAFIPAGIYFLFRERFILASGILGFATNFHALYSFFPMFYLLVYLGLNTKRHGWLILLKSCLSYFLFALPILIWILNKSLPHYIAGGNTISPSQWIPLYKLGCPQNFIFDGMTLGHLFANPKEWFFATQKYWFFLFLLILNFSHNEEFRRERKVAAVLIGALALMAISYFFTYIQPSRFIIDLNFVRNIQFLNFIFMGYSSLFFIRLIKSEKPFNAYCILIMFIFFSFSDTIAILAAILLTIFLFAKKLLSRIKKERAAEIALKIIGCVCCAILIFILKERLAGNGARAFYLTIALILILPAIFYGINSFLTRKLKKELLSSAQLFIILPLIILLVYFGYRHHRYVTIEKQGTGFWQLQRDWEDVQRHVQTDTPKDAVILAPIDMEMGGFRILSERTLICCERDCGIVGFDYHAAEEWRRRRDDVSAFRVLIKDDIRSALTNAIVRYQATHIIFTSYSQPKEKQGVLQKIYANNSFALYKIAVSGPR
ncbi:MAG: DUF6798 domain-containing protein [Candidatus Omnitrophota bacterium]